MSVLRRLVLVLIGSLLLTNTVYLAVECAEPDGGADGAGGVRRLAALEPRRRVYAPYFPGTIEWADAGIFWFGRVDPPENHSGRNYADVRVAYTADELVVYVNIEDYYVWYDTDATLTSDLTQYDAVAVYLDTDHDGAGSPQPDDYLFLSGLCIYGCGDGSNHRRQARGTGVGWDFDWSGAWTDRTWANWWCNPGPNSNDCGIDFGWWSYVHIPWSTLGLSGPPSRGVLWGLGVLLYDRDDRPPAGYAAPEHWPEIFQSDVPSTWGELAFGLATYMPQPAVPQGTTLIRRGLGASIVEDAWVGGGGECTGGHMGDPDHDNYGDDTSLYVENQSLIADFTCFSKAFLRFYLGDIPPGKTIISATLTLHHWGNARGDLAEPSLIWLFTVDGGWEEDTLTWNNAPLARENLTATWVDVLTAFPGWPGVPYEWDATQAVAEAYAAGEPLNIAFYTADTNFHSSKYFSSSDTGDWNAEGRPTLTVVWGERLATVEKQVHPAAPALGEAVTYTLKLLGNGQPLTLTDDLPAEVSAPMWIQVSGGPAASYDAGAHRLTWSGSPEVGQPVTIAFPVTVEVSGPRAVFNTGVLTDTDGMVSADRAVFIVDAHRCWLPVMLRNW